MSVCSAKIQYLHETKALIVKIEPASGNDCATPEQTFGLLGHCDYKISFFEDILDGDWTFIPLLFLSLVLEAPFIAKVTRSEDDMSSRGGEMLSTEGVSMFYS